MEIFIFFLWPTVIFYPYSDKEVKKCRFHCKDQRKNLLLLTLAMLMTFSLY